MGTREGSDRTCQRGTSAAIAALGPQTHALEAIDVKSNIFFSLVHIMPDQTTSRMFGAIAMPLHAVVNNVRLFSLYYSF